MSSSSQLELKLNHLKLKLHFFLVLMPGKVSIWMV